LLLGCSFITRLFQRVQDEYLPIRGAGFSFLGTLKTGPFPSSHWPKALLPVRHAGITMLPMVFRNGRLPLE